MMLTERKTIPMVSFDCRTETIWWGDTDDYTSVHELPDGSVVVEETTDEGAFVHWYDCDGTFDAVVAAFTEED